MMRPDRMRYKEMVEMQEISDWLLGKDADYEPEFRTEEEYIAAQ